MNHWENRKRLRFSSGRLRAALFFYAPRCSLREARVSGGDYESLRPQPHFIRRSYYTFARV